MNMTKKNSVLPTDDLNDNAAYPFMDGADEIVLRVCSYDFSGKNPVPKSFQAIVRGRDRNKAWGVGIRSNPVAALTAAIPDFFATRERLSNTEVSAIENDIRPGEDFEELPEPEQTADLDIDDLLS